MTTGRLSNPAGLLHRAAAAAPDRLALVDISEPGTHWTWAQWNRRVSAAADALGNRGFAPGDRVALQLPTGADFTVCYLGALRAGLVAVPVNPAYTAAEVDHIRHDCGPALFLDAIAAADLLGDAADLDTTEIDTTDIEEGAGRSADEVAALLYTSGTSGLAKGAMLSGRALLANVDQVASVRPPLLTEADVLFAALPLAHVFGLNAALGTALRVGATLVLADRFDPAATLAAMAQHRVSAVLGVPGQFAAWLAHPDMAAGFAGVRFAMSGSTTLTRAVVEGFAAAGIVLHDGYGLTEAAPVVTINALGSGREDPTPGSIGTALPGIEVELRDADGEVADDGDPGRIFLRGRNLFSGYWPDGSDGPDEHGWFGTGDIAVSDAGGQLRIVGRSNDLVIVNGFNVYPAEVEAVLAAHPGVAEVAVVGVADPGTGEAVHAYVVPAPDATLDVEALRTDAAGSLARFKLPSTIEIVGSLPRTVTGKIMKWQLDRAGD